MKSSIRVRVSKPLLDETDAKAVYRAVKNGDISGLGGSELTDFQDSFAKFVGSKYALATTSCYSALHLALATAGVSEGDEVIVTSFTNISSVLPIIYLGARPVFVDIDPESWNMDPKLMQKKITKRTKAIVVVHIFGHSADMDPIMALAKRHNLIVIEDVAEALGGSYRGRPLGSIGDFGAFSFLANKFITTGEGGMLVMNNAEDAQKAQSLRSLAFGLEDRFMHTDFGYNYRMSNILAALGLSQMKKLQIIIKRKREIGKHYSSTFRKIEEFQLPIERDYTKNVYWMYLIVLRGALDGKRKEFMSLLTEAGVEVRAGFTPMNRQRIFIDRGLAKENDCPVARRIGENSFYIPSGPDITERDLKWVAKQVVLAKEKLCAKIK